MQEPWNWTKEDLDHLIGQSESLRMDFKQSSLFARSHERIVENLSREISAFANTEGGVIVIGIVERREGKTRIADYVDGGVDGKAWPPERFQQLIESNISPPLTGLRVNPITLDEAKAKYAFVVYVPQGSTAYQASDKRYYGRSEYESKALLDHEIRLRMFRGRVPSAAVRLLNCQVTQIQVTKSDVRNRLGDYAKIIRGELDRLSPNEQLLIDRYCFDVGVENT